jgi:hypothetical protein
MARDTLSILTTSVLGSPALLHPRLIFAHLLSRFYALILAQGSTFPVTAVSVVCGLGKSGLIFGVYPELFELTLSLFDGFKKRKNPESTNYR